MVEFSKGDLDMSREYLILPQNKYDVTKAHVHRTNLVIVVFSCEIKLQHRTSHLVPKLDTNRFFSQMFLVETTRVY